MFLDYYQLRDQPFGVTPDPRHLYLSCTHREALASLYFGLEFGRGFLGLIAKPGMGKTTLLFQLRERLNSTARTVFLFQTQCNSHELLQYLMSDLGFDTRGQDIVTLHQQLNELLAREMLAGKKFVLIIDEAQNLDHATLETIRLLSDFETPEKKMLQIVLSGQPQLAEKLALPGLVQLRQRIAILSRLEPFDPAETAHYVVDRLQVAGYAGSPLFTREALEMIAAHSQGIPRSINNLCFNALSLGYAMDRKKIDTDTLREVIADLNLDSLASVSTSASARASTPTRAAAFTTATGSARSTPIPASTPAPRTSQKPVVIPTKPASPLSYTYASARKGIFSGQAFRAAAVAAVVIIGGLAWFTFKGNIGNIAWRIFTPPTPTAIQAAPVAAADENTAPPSETPWQADTAPAIPTTLEEVAGKPHGVQEAKEIELPQSFVVVVQPNDTLRQICMRSVGRYDRAVLNEILSANQELVDPDQIEVGQRIRIPLGSATAGSRKPRARMSTSQ